MVKPGGPCQGPGATEGTICGVTEISDKSDWRKGGKFKPEHKGKACCTKNACRIFLGVIADPKIAKAEAASAPAPQASGPLGGLLEAASAALNGRSAPAAAPAAASASAASASSAPPAPIATAGKRSGRGAAAASAAATAAAPPAQPAQPDPPDGAPPARTPRELQQVMLDLHQLPDNWSVGLAQVQGQQQLYFWPRVLPEQRWTTWRSPLDAPSLAQVYALEGHQVIERGDSFYREWRVHGKFYHADDKFMVEETS